MLKKSLIFILVVALTACGGDDNNNNNNQSPTPTPTTTPTPSPSPEPSPTPEPSPSPTPEPSPSPTPEPSPSPTPEPSPTPTPEPSPSPTPEPSPTPSPDPTPSPTPLPHDGSVAFTFDAEADLANWQTETWEGTGTLELSHELDGGTEGVMVMTPTWETVDDKLVAFYTPISPLDLTDADVSVDVYVPEAYVSDGSLGIKVWFKDGDGRYANIAFQSASGLTGDAWNTLSYSPVSSFEYSEAEFDATDVVTAGVELDAAQNSKPVGVEGVFKVDNLEISEYVAPEPSLSIDFESDTAGTTYGTTGWNDATVISEVVTIASVSGLPANGDSVNVLKVSPSDYNYVPKFSVTIPDGQTLADYVVKADIYFPRDTLGLTEEADNYYKPLLLLAGAPMSAESSETNPLFQSKYDTVWNDVDVWKTFTLTPDSTKGAGLTGAIEISIGISRPAVSGGDDYYIDNVRLELAP